MLNLYHLKYFYDACDKKSLVHAARVNRVSHSAVSQAIRSLESSLGTELLVHAHRRFELTTDGALLFKSASSIFETLDGALNTLRSAKLEPEGPLRIGFSHSIALSFFSESISRFCLRYPAVSPSLRIGNSTALESLLDSREIEVGFGMDEPRFAKFEKRELSSGHFILVARKGAGKGGKPDPNCFLVGDKGEEVDQLRKHLRRARPQARFIEVQSWELTAQLATQGLGLGLVPDFMLSRGGGKPGALIKVASDAKLPEYRLCAFFRSERSLSVAAGAFLKFVAKT